MKQITYKLCSGVIHRINGIRGTLLSIYVPRLHKYSTCSSEGKPILHINTRNGNLNPNGSNNRFYCTTTPSLPKLCNEDFNKREKIFGQLRIAIIVFFNIKPLLEPAFRIRDFLTASEKVLSILSNRIAQNDIGALESLVTPDLFCQIEKNLPLFSESQRQELCFNDGDVASSLISDIVVVEGKKDTRTVHIYTIHHCVKNLKQSMERFRSLTQNAIMQGMKPEMPKELEMYIAFMKLSRNFDLKNKSADDWIVSALTFDRYKMKTTLGFS